MYVCSVVRDMFLFLCYVSWFLFEIEKVQLQTVLILFSGFLMQEFGVQVL